MRKEVLVLIAVAVALSASAAEAGPFRRQVARTTMKACTGDSCVSSRTVVRGSGAQAHAEAMASSGSMVHAGSHGDTYEGVGCGSSPQAALAACCNNGRAVLEEGVAFGHGRWFACRRYSLR